MGASEVVPRDMPVLGMNFSMDGHFYFRKIEMIEGRKNEKANEC